MNNCILLTIVQLCLIEKNTNHRRAVIYCWSLQYFEENIFSIHTNPIDNFNNINLISQVTQHKLLLRALIVRYSFKLVNLYEIAFNIINKPISICFYSRQIICCSFSTFHYMLFFDASRIISISIKWEKPIPFLLLLLLLLSETSYL